MKLKTFKPNIPVVLEGPFGNKGARHLFQVGAMNCTAIDSTLDGIVVRLERPKEEGPELVKAYLITPNGCGEVENPDELDGAA